jgi:steroid 5-alpha reductase family enzyme
MDAPDTSSQINHVNDIINQLVVIGVGAAALMLVLWIVQVAIKDAGVVDVGWAFGLGCAAIYAGVSGEGDPTRRVLIAAIGGAWGLRLAWHLLTDRVIGAKEEDGRYKDLRAKLGPRTNLFHFFFFQFQAALVVGLAIPFLFAASDTGPFPRITDIAGALLWFTGIIGESIADRQLKAFKELPDSRGKTCRVGLWQYSRHPNYFFEWLMWCSYALVASGADHGVWAALAPAFMLLLILKVTGIPPTEARALRTRGDDYREYQRTTSAFVPWFPKHHGVAIDAD